MKQKAFNFQFSFACEEESNFCASSCSRTRDQTPVSIGTRQESEPNRSCNYQSGSQWGTAKGSSFGDVQGMGPEAGSASWFTSSKIKSGKDNESLAESERSLGSSNGTNLLKPPSGSFSVSRFYHFSFLYRIEVGIIFEDKSSKNH